MSRVLFLGQPARAPRLFDIIDNAAHLGGLVGGIIAGLVLVRGSEAALNLAPAKRLTYAGDIALILTLLTAAGAVFATAARYLK